MGVGVGVRGVGNRDRTRDEHLGTFIAVCVSVRSPFPKAQAPRPHLPLLDPLLSPPVLSPFTGAASSWGTSRAPRAAAACHQGSSPGPFRCRSDPRGCCTGYGGREAGEGGGGGGAGRAGICARGGDVGPAGSWRALLTIRIEARRPGHGWTSGER